MLITQASLPQVPFPAHLCGDWFKVQTYAILKPQPIVYEDTSRKLAQEPSGIAKRVWNALGEEWMTKSQITAIVNRDGGLPISHTTALKALRGLVDKWGIQKSGRHLYKL